MAGLTMLLSAAFTLAVPDFIVAQNVRATAKASTPLALPLAHLAASAPRAATNLESTPSSVPKPLATPAVAAVAASYHGPKAAAEAKIGRLNGSLESVADAQLQQPPKVIVETNYIVYTQVMTVTPPIPFITVTKTVQPPTPPPPPPPTPTPPAEAPPTPPTPPTPLRRPPSKPKQAGPHPPPAVVPSQPSQDSSPIATSSSSSPPSPPAPQGLATSETTTSVASSSPPTPVLTPTMSSSPNPGSGGSPTPVPNPQAQGGPAGGQPRGPPMGPPDPMDGAFPGGVPNKNVDLPITLMFMLLFIIGAYVHMTIYKKNAKGGHKFLLSLPIFQFCMVRIVTCLFRVVWSLVTTRGVVLMAQITENGGAVALFAVNIFFAQRLVRSIHPKWGWATGFGQLIFILVITIPVVVIFNVTTAIVSFLSAGNADRLEVTEDLLMLETSWITSLAIFPIIVVSASLSIPGPKPERFGSGSQRVKVALLYFASVLLITGQSIRMYSVFAKEPPGTTNFAYSKEVFYTTGFAFELVVVGLYALFRVDLRFHIPNGSSGPGDYSGNGKNGGYTVEEIERMIGSLDVPHQIMRERKGSEDMDMVFTIFFASKKDDETAAKVEDATLAKTPKRTTRRKTLLNAFKPREPPIPGDPNDYPDVAHMYQEGGGGEYAARQSGKLSTFSPFDNSKVSDARYQQYWRSYGKEKGTKAWEA